MYLNFMDVLFHHGPCCAFCFECLQIGPKRKLMIRFLDIL